MFRPHKLTLLRSISFSLTPSTQLTPCLVRTTTTRTAKMSSDQLNKESEQAAASTSAKWEAGIKRNPHGDFKTVEASRPPFPAETSVHYVQTPLPSWKYGQGPNKPQPSTVSHTPISPYSEGRPAGFNYKLLISAITPRPIAFVSTRSADGKTTNLSPFSYFSVINHDPPLFTIGFSSALAAPKDTLKLLAETKECVVNIISEDFIEAANSTSVNAPFGVSEWDVSGLTPAYDCQEVKAARVKEAVFSVECKLESLREFDSRSNPGKKSGCLAILEGVSFWVRSDAINEEGNMVDPAVLRPVSRLGGITYGRTTELFELPRPDFEKDVGGQTAIEELRTSKAEGGKLN